METGQGPKYRRLAAGLEIAIGRGELGPGDKLPPVRDLAWRLGVTPGTVARAFTVLAEAGRVVAEVGRGTFVAEPGQAGVPAAPYVPDLDAAPPLYLEAADDREDFLSPRLPDIGQLALVREGLMRAAAAPVEKMLAYPTFASHAALREVVRDWLPEDMRHAVARDEVVMTNGGQNAILLVLQALTYHTSPVVLVEQHTYTGIRRAAENLRARVVAVAMDEQGVRPEALEAAAREEEARIFFTMPEAHNPTTIMTSPERRAEVAEISRRLGIHVIQDDCYRLGPPAGPSYRALAPELGWYISSLSKAITPALRVGYAAAPKGMAALLRRVVDTNFYGLSRPISDTAAHVLAHADTPALVEAMRAHLQRYVEAAVNMLGRFNLRWGENTPFLWLELPEGWREAGFVQALDAEGIRVRAGEEFAARDARGRPSVRISVNGQMSLDRFQEAMGRIAYLLDHPPERIMV